MTTTQQIIEHNKAEGYRFFSDSNMQTFGTEVIPGVHQGKYFLTSDKWSNGRYYCVREYEPETGNVKSYKENGELVRFKYLKDAEEFMHWNFPEGGWINVDLVHLEAWACPDGWDINSIQTLEKDINIHPDQNTTRRILKFLRDSGFLSDESKGELTVDFHNEMVDYTYIEVLKRSNGMPLVALTDMYRSA